MSHAPTGSQQTPGPKLIPPPKTRPVLPIVAFGKSDAPPQVFYVLLDAEREAKEHPTHEFYDARSILLTAAGDGSPRLEAHGAGQPAELQRRLMAELRRVAEPAMPGEPAVAEIRAALDWFDAAPDPAYVVHALGLAEHDYRTRSKRGVQVPGGLDDEKSRRCIRCSALQRLLGKPGCCP